MKLNELKHNHSLTELLKILIFSLLMLAPLLASVSQMLYATFNKNAYQSYSANYIQSTSLINNTSTYIEGGNYLLTYVENEEVSPNYSSKFYFTKISIDVDSYNLPFEPTYFRVRSDGYVYFGDDVNPQDSLPGRPWGDTITNIYFTSANNTYQSSSFVGGNTLLYLLIYKQDKLDNAFYYGVKQMTESELFNWTQNTALYSGIYGMTSNLEIQTPAIAILLTYWTILTIIYVIIDIVLKGFTYMTHFLQMKV